LLIGNREFHDEIRGFQPVVLLHVHSFGHFEPVMAWVWIFDWTILQDIGVRAELRKSPFRTFCGIVFGSHPQFDLRNSRKCAHRAPAALDEMIAVIRRASEQD
jgi:hypothetical protein